MRVLPAFNVVSLLIVTKECVMVFVVQSLSCVWLCDTMNCSMPSFPWHAKLSPQVCSTSYPLSQWCHPTISFSVTSFFSCPQSFLASRSFPMSWLFTSGEQSIGVSTSASVLSMNTKGWFLLGLTDLISLLSKGLSRVFSNTIVRKHQFFSSQPFLYGLTLTFIHDYRKNHSFDYMDLFLAKWCLCFFIFCLGLS